MTGRKSVLVTALGLLAVLGFGIMALYSGFMGYMLGTSRGASFLASLQAEWKETAVVTLRDLHPLQLALIQHPRAVALVMFNICVVGALLGVTLTLRVRWARAASIVALVLAMTCLTGELVWEASHLTPAMPPEERAIRILIPLVWAVFLGWIVIQLQTPAVRAEFESEATIRSGIPPTTG